MDLIEDGTAFCVAGNHEAKLGRKLNGRNVRATYGLKETLEQMESTTPEFVERTRRFIDGLVSHYVLDGGKLVVAHAGLKESMHGRASGNVRSFALYGDTTGETDEYGLPVRYPWAEDYRGDACVVYGHTPVPEPEWLNRTINLDTGCVFGGMLTALRYPEREVVSVDAHRQWYEPARPFLPEETKVDLGAQHEHDDVLDIGDLAGRRHVRTELRGNVTISETHNAAALEVMSRFAANPKWLIHLPPTMSPCETSSADGYLERPEQALDYYANRDVERVVCQEKHMGSRAIVVVTREDDVAMTRFGLPSPGAGIVVSRTGRAFFNDQELERALLLRVRDAMTKSELWARFETDWICLDAELMPWSAKARELVRTQYAAVGVSAQTSLRQATEALAQAAARGLDVVGLDETFRTRHDAAQRYVEAYRHYCWPVNDLTDLKLAPFHVLATENHVHVDRNHGEHMAMIAEIAAADGAVIVPTSHRVVELSSETSRAEVVAWWEEMTARGGEGMVVKPWDFIARGKRGVMQPALKVRGREYLRIIYGPDYTEPDNLARLRKRGLAKKRALALQEFALGIEALRRFCAREPLARTHEAVLGVLALESEPIDPRL